MQYLLSRSCRPILTRLAGERTLCAFDFDGTLSPIVNHPKRAGMRFRTRKLLAELAATRPCIVVSGRSRADLLEKLDALKLARVIGNHGAETKAPSSAARKRTRQWKSTLEPDLCGLRGVWIEDKGLSLAVHFRESKQRAAARRKILASVQKLTNVRVFGGKLVVNIAPADAPDKGEALAAERKRLRCDWVLYVGDDDNDEDAFALNGNVVAVRIGKKRRSRARYYLRSQSEIDKLLELLA
jgi:trehalose 6-phosphate phosphatase